MPTMAKVMGENIAGRAAELLNFEKGASIHDIIAALLTTLEQALLKARSTEDRLHKHKLEMQQMCDETLREMESDFVIFADRLAEKEELSVSELHTYREDTTAKITANTLTINNYQAVIDDHIQYAERVMEKGNDYQMFKQTKEMKNQMVMMYAELAKMRLQYDGIMFQLASNEFDVPIDYVGTLMNAATKAPVDWSPSANKQRTKNMFITTDSLNQIEEDQFRSAFRQYDKDSSGEIEVSELIQLWQSIWPWASYDELKKTVYSFLESIDKDRSGCVDFEEFMKIMKMGATTSGGAFHVK